MIAWSYFHGMRSKSQCNLQISGPASATVAGLKLLRGTVSYYQAVVQLPANFWGQATVSFTVRLQHYSSQCICHCVMHHSVVC